MAIVRNSALFLLGAGMLGIGVANVAGASAGDLSAPIKATDGTKLGQAQLTGAPGGVLLRVSVEGVKPGWHALHFHAKGDCSDPKFEKAGGHINHQPKKAHGLLNPQGPDFGDLPNLYVAADGTGQAEFFSTFVSLKPGGDRLALLDEDGSALVMHANPDDFTTQPIGGAGGRIGCAVLR